MLCDPADALSRPDGSSGVWRPSGDATEKASEVPRRERGSSSLSCAEGMPLEVFDELKDMLIDGGLGFLKEGSGELGPTRFSGCARAHACSRVSERA